MTLPMVVPDREPLTMAEARRIGLSATRYSQLRDLLANSGAGSSYTVKTSNGAQALALDALDTQATLGLLIEREAQFLSSMGVTVE